MVQNIWQAAANMVATHIRNHDYRFHRALLVIPRERDEVLIAWVFGNDNYQANDRVREDVDQIRQRLHELTVEELAFGLSGDGQSWALVVQADSRGYQTQVAKTFRKEMVLAVLDEAVQGAGPPPFTLAGEGAGALDEKCQPAS